MYPHFIEVHEKDRVYSLNIDHIIGFNSDGETGSMITIGTDDVRGDKVWTHCNESYDEVKKLIESSGVLINMGDPRLNTKHRLTKEDIKEMQAGEPVWNSNDREWYQIAGWNGQNDFYVTLQSIHKVIRLSEDDLIKFPFYRMKVPNGQQD